MREHGRRARFRASLDAQALTIGDHSAQLQDAILRTELDAPVWPVQSSGVVIASVETDDRDCGHGVARCGYRKAGTWLPGNQT